MRNVQKRLSLERLALARWTDGRSGDFVNGLGDGTEMSRLTLEPRVSTLLAMETETSKEPIVRLTESAAGQVKTMQAEQPEHAGKTLRVYVEKGGCSGMQYGLVFDERRENDLVSEWFGVPVIVDPFSADYLRGAVVDFSDSLNAGGFKIVNPNAQQSCGCGNSFQT